MSIGGDEYGAGEEARSGTRTRLPGEDGDVYGVGRGPSRPGRSLLMVVGVVVLLIAAIAFANRGGGDVGDHAGGDGGAAGTSPTAPTGDKPVRASDDATGIPAGFAHTKQGAQSAAANYAVALGGDGMFSAAQRQRIVTAVYAPGVVEARQKGLDRVYSDPDFLGRIGLNDDGSAPDGMTFVSRVNPVGSKVTDYSTDSAKVAVWYSTLFGLAGEKSKNPVSESWYTDTFTLTWADGDWKVTDLQQKDGPTPVGRDQKASTAEKMAKAVEGFGGFTYAR
jgi:hypothetical protein